MDEGIVEGGKDTSNAENELACKEIMSILGTIGTLIYCRGRRTITGQRSEGDILLGSTGSSSLGRHGDYCR